MLLLCLAVVAAQIPASLMLWSQSTRVSRVAFAARMGLRITGLVRVLSVTPPDITPQVIAAYNMPQSRFAVDGGPRVAGGMMDADEAGVARAMAAGLRLADDRVRVQLVENGKALIRYLPWRATRKTLLVSIRLTNAGWLNGEARVVQPDAPVWLQTGLLQVGAAVFAMLMTLGLGSRHIIMPVMALADAASRAGRGASTAPLTERGPRELRVMTGAFNAMQARLRAFVDDRTRLLGAISHDLRTPLASLWLRAEMVGDAELRDAMVRTLAEMKSMVEATLVFSRDHAVQHRGFFDLAELARQVVDDHSMLGQEVSFSGPDAAPFHGSSLALRRVLDNLIENAVRYGKRARIAVVIKAETLRIQVDDDGPGVPPDRIEDMFKPFVQLDRSRNPHAGGTGLGLAIARSAIREHGGDLTLANRPEGGLRAEFDLPIETSSYAYSRPGCVGL